MPQRIVSSENARQPKGCLIASAIVFLAFIGLLIYAAVQIALK
jgi:hypothetical protein